MRLIVPGSMPFILSALLALALLCAAPGKAEEAALEQLPQVAVTLRSASGEEHHYTVWMARSSEERSRGLMFVEELSEDGGMLFLYEPPRPVRMWMKNTLIPLDMLFIDADGQIAHIHPRAIPGSEAIIESPIACAAVLELAGGAAELAGLSVGDRLDWAPLATAGALSVSE